MILICRLEPTFVTGESHLMHLTFEKLTELTKHLAGAIYRDTIPLTDWRIVDDLGYGTPLPPDNSNSALSPTKGEIPLLRKFPLALHSYTALPSSI